MERIDGSESSVIALSKCPVQVRGMIVSMVTLARQMKTARAGANG